MSAEPTQYRIETLKDILAIPEGRIDAFLAELKDWYVIAKSTGAMLSTIAESVGVEEQIDYGINWIDDGKQDKKIILRAREEQPDDPR